MKKIALTMTIFAFVHTNLEHGYSLVPQLEKYQLPCNTKLQLYYLCAFYIEKLMALD